MNKSRTEAELHLLTALESNEPASQQSIAHKLLVSVGMVNALLKRAVRKGFVKVASVPKRRFAYYVTPKGFLEKSRLVAEYLDVSLAFVRKAMDVYAQLFERSAKMGLRKVVLVGSGELAELAQAAARDAGIEIVGIYIPGSNHVQLHGLPVLTALADVPRIDCLVLTESRQPQQVYDKLVPIVGAVPILVPDFLHVTRHSSDVAALCDEVSP